MTAIIMAGPVTAPVLAGEMVVGEVIVGSVGVSEAVAAGWGALTAMTGPASTITTFCPWCAPVVIGAGIVVVGENVINSPSISQGVYDDFSLI